MKTKLKIKDTGNIGAILRSCRESKGLTVKELGIPHSSVTTLELGVYKDAKLSTIIGYAKGLGMKKLVINI